MKLLFIIIIVILSLTILTLLYLLRKKNIILKQTKQDLQLLQFAENIKYEMELRTYRSGYFNLLDKYLALKIMLDNQTERLENERAINENLKKRLNSIYGMEKDISEPLND